VSSLTAKRALAHMSPICVAAVLAGAVCASSCATAAAASTVNIKETGHLQATSKSGALLTEHGPISGSFGGALTLYLVKTPTGVTFRLSVSSPRGTLSGHGSADIEPNGKLATVSGQAIVSSGSGSYAHAHAAGLSVTGTFNRETYSLTVTISGRLS
jgi:hypothetical protein